MPTQRTRMIGAVTIALVATSLLFATGRNTTRESADQERPLLVLTGRESEIDEPTYRIARSQEVFDELWTAHMAERGEHAAQGWPMTPQIDFDTCDALFVFGGDRINTNGYSVVDMIENQRSVTVRIERITYQTISFDGADRGDPARPWAMILLPTTKKTLTLEENVQSLIRGDPKWKQRATFPGRIGVGEPVKGTRQTNIDR